MNPAAPRRLALLALIVVLACWTVPCSADDIYVTTSDDTNDGICGGPLHFPCSLRDAIISANARPGLDTIHVPPGTYHLTIPGIGEDGGMTGDLDIQDYVTILGDSADSTIIDALGIDRVFHVSHWIWAQFTDVTIRGGDSSTSPVSTHGGGILNEGDAVSLTRCVVENNVTTTGTGGGIANLSDSMMFVLDSVIRDNQATWGSGTSSAYGTVIINRSTITGNYALGTGTWAGAVWVRDADVTIRSSTIYHNETQITNRPGGLSFRGGQIRIESCTLADNDWEDIFIDDAAVASVTLNNTIIRGTCSGWGYHTEGGNVGDHGDNCGMNGPGDYWAVPIYLHPLGDYGGLTPTAPPMYVSNDGNLSIDNDWASTNCQPEDQRGVIRPLDGNGDGVAVCDSGAVEVSFDDLPFADGFESGDVSAWPRWVR